MKYLWVILGLALLSGCAPDLTIYATKPGKLQLDQIEYLVVEPFEDQTGVVIDLPQGLNVKSNAALGPLLRAQVLKGLSSGGQYRLLPDHKGLQGVQPALGKVAILRAKLAYFEMERQGGDQQFHVFLAKKTNTQSVGELLAVTAGSAIASSAERSGKGFKVAHPYVERAAALQVTFLLVSALDGEPLAAPITKNLHFHKKWGGTEGSSMLDPDLEAAFGVDNLNVEDLWAELGQVDDRLRMKTQNPDEYIAKGYHLKEDVKVPLLLSDLRARLSREAAQALTQQISQHQVPFALDLSGGDGVAINLIKGGAFNEAINRLEALPAPLDAGDQYNLGVAYEAMGEYAQARRKYGAGLDADPGSSLFKQALQRVQN
ncbi:MAG: hypothetical protein RRB13_10085 [bacterium]|nr:hypothetical protein [bacterium]